MNVGGQCGRPRDVVAWALVVAATAGTPTACGDDIDFPDRLVWSSEHFAYYARDDDPAMPCPALADLFEPHFAAVSAYLHLDPWPAGRIIRYFKFTDARDALRVGACRVRGACAGYDVRSYQSFHEHELIHAYLSPFGEPPALFEEGAAVVLACDRADSAKTYDLIPWDAAIRSNDPGSDTGIYTAGSVLVHHLLVTYGAVPFMQLYAELPHAATPEVVNAAMQRIYGATADDIWQQALAAPGGCIPVGRCARPEVPVDGTPVAVGDVCGIDWDRRTFTMPATGNVTVGTSSSGWFTFGTCDDEPHQVGTGQNDSPAIGFSPSGPQTPTLTLTQLGAGRHFVEFANMPADLAITAPAEPWAGATCDEVRPLAIAPTGSLYPAVRLYPPPDTAEWIVKLQIDGGAHAFGTQATNVRVTVCPTCDLAAPECRSGAAYDALELEPASALVLRLRPGAPNPNVVEKIAVDLIPR